MDKIKVYEFEVTWGSQTTTDDLEGEVMTVSPHRPSRDDVEKALQKFIGHIEQIPPDFSAIRVNGKRAYDLARNSVAVELKARTVFIDNLQLISMQGNDRAIFRVTCGKGTYVRSLARDLALCLGTYGHVSMLKRLRVGKFLSENAISLEKIQELGHKVLAEGYLHPIADVLDDIPAICINADQEVQLLHGQTIGLTPHQAEGLLSGTVLCVQEQGKALAIGSFNSGFVKPNRVFNKT